MVNLETFRDRNGYIQLRNAFVEMLLEENIKMEEDKFNEMVEYFKTIESIKPIYSRQAAAMALATAKHLFLR